jgi:hypothetical protein
MFHNIINFLTIDDITNIIENLIKKSTDSIIKRFLNNIENICLTKSIIEYISNHTIEFNNLDLVICSYQQITDEQIMLIPKTITKLNIYTCFKLTSNSIKHFINLTHLNIAFNNITDESLENMNLEYLNCACSKITINAFINMSNLKMLNACYVGLSSQNPKFVNLSKIKYCASQRVDRNFPHHTIMKINDVDMFKNMCHNSVVVY